MNRKIILLKYMSSKSIEDEFVTDVYNSIASHFNHTRYKRWAGVKHFLDNLPRKTIIADIGCGNGKNMVPGEDLDFVGVDISKELCKIAYVKTGFKVLTGSVLDLPLDDNSFDHAISIAVLHHLSKKEDRVKAITEIVRIIKPGGTAMITVWAFDDTGNDTKRSTKSGLIKWEISKDEVYQRYYYLFDNGELDDIAKSIDGVEIISSSLEKNNYYLIIQKKKLIQEIS